jgi:hypothetical protein
MELRLREFPHRGPIVWIAVTAGIFFWAVHLVASAALVEPACNDSSLDWVLNGLTVVCAGFTLIAGLITFRMMRDPSPNTRFLGVLGTLSNGINFLLIVVEGLVITGVHPCVGR